MAQATPHNANRVITTCPAPMPSTSRRIAIILGRANSRPKENSRNTTPNSAIWTTDSGREIHPSPPGPISTPTRI